MKELRLIEMMGNIDEKLLLRANAPVPLFGKPRFRAAFAAAVVAALLAITMIASPVAMAVSYGNAHPEIEGGLVYVMDAMIKDEDHFLNSLLPEGVKNTLGSVFDALKGGNHDENEGGNESETEPELVIPPASEGLEYELNADNNGYKLMGIGSCQDKDLVIPAEYNGLPVTEIYWNYTSGDYAFENNTTIESLIIPASVQFIGEYVFSHCTSLKSVTILPGDTPVELGCGSFSGCTALEQFTIPDNVIRFSDPFSLSSTNNYTKKVFPKVTEYDNAYYLGNQNNPYFVLVGIKDITLTNCEIHPDTKIIGGGAFYKSALTEIVIPEGVITIDDQAFSQTTALTSFSFPDSLRFVGGKAFVKCGAINSYADFDYVGNEDNPYLILFDSKLVSQDKIHPETRYIADRAMQEARVRPNYIKTWTVPEHVRYIGKSAFIGDTAMNRVQTIEIRGDHAYIAEGIFYMCNTATNLYIGKGVTYITPRTFGKLPQLSSITVEQGNPVYVSIGNCLIENESGTLMLAACNATIPEDGSIKHIAAGAYWGIEGKQLPSNPIPEGVLTIGGFALYNYNSSRATTPLTIPGTVTRIAQHAFSSPGTVYYSGTKEEFSKLLNKIILNGTVICTDGEIQISSN